MVSELKGLLSQAIDLHVHGIYEGRPRYCTMMEMAMDAAKAGMRALVFKSKDGVTAGCAHLVDSHVEGIRVFGGVVLDYSVGGLNPWAVYSCLKMGGKVIWMPSFDSEWTLKKVSESTGGAKVYQKLLDSERKVKGISILKGGLYGSDILPEVREIISLVAAKGAILETSHLSPRESLILVEEAKKGGLERIVITHVNSDIIGASIEEQKTLAKKGAFLMYTFAPCMPSPWREAQPLEKVIRMIKEVGPEKCVLATDFGMINYPPPVEGMRMFITGLLMAGVKEKDLEKMVKTNPAFLLNL